MSETTINGAAATINANANGHGGAVSESDGSEGADRLEALLHAAAAGDQDARRAVFDHLAGLDTFDQAAARGRVCEVLDLRAADYRALLRAAEAERRARALSAATTFAVQDGHFVELRRVGRDTVALPLCNFTAWVVEDLTIDDGERTERSLTLEGELDDGSPLPRVTIPIADFASLKWLIPSWGPRVIVEPLPFAAERLRAAIQHASGAAAAARAYSHTGWATVDGQRAYLSATGGIGARGQIAARVQLPMGLECYALPAPGAVDPAEAARASLRFLALAPLSVTAPLLAAVALAPLLPMLPLGATIWVYGASGVYKTSLLAEAMRHFGADFSALNLPAAWADSENALEAKAYFAKDALLAVDDYAPALTGAEASVYAARASRFLRAVGNHSGRGRLNPDLTARRTFRPRGLAASTGEVLPTGSESLIARVFVVEVKQGAVDLDALTDSQRLTGALYSHAFAGYVRWIAERWDALADDLTLRFADKRGMVGQDREIVHGRSADVYLALALALATYGDFCAAVGALTRDEMERQRLAWLGALAATARAQRAYIASERPTLRFAALLRSLLHAGRVRLEGAGGARALGGGLGEPVGWVDQDYAYLDPQAAYAAVARYAKEADARFALSADALWRMMDADGWLVRDNDGHRAPKRTDPDGNRRRVLQIRLDRLLDEE